MTTNELLRAHVTRVGFNLTLTKNQIAALVELDARLSDDRPTKEKVKDETGRVQHRGRNILSNSVSSHGALIARGLLLHHPTKSHQPDGTWIDRTDRDYWSFTAAGRAVITLLKESGLWDEVAAEIPWVKPPPERPTYSPDEEIARLHERLATADAQVREAREQRNEEIRRANKAHTEKERAENRLARLQEQVRDLMAGVAA